jgi:hypothetical protein
MMHEGCYGTIEFDDGIIRLRERRPYFSQHQEMQTLLHEIIHAVDYTLGIQLAEEQTTRLAVGLMAVIRDNNLCFLSEEEQEKDKNKIIKAYAAGCKKDGP